MRRTAAALLLASIVPGSPARAEAPEAAPGRPIPVVAALIASRAA
jgi:hypothetical protein